MTKYLFRRRAGLFTKDLGWGWIPIRWEGWLILVVSVGIMVWFSRIMQGKDLYFAIGFILLFLIFIMDSTTKEPLIFR